MRRGSWRVALAAAAVLLAWVPTTSARYEYAREQGVRCSSCHDTHHPGAENLNAAGRYYFVHKTLAGWNAAASQAPAAPRPEARPARKPSAQPLFARNCAPCHGAKGEGTAKARPLSPPQRAKTEAEIEKVVRDGIEGSGMFAFGELLTAEQIRALGEHVRSLRGEH